MGTIVGNFLRKIANIFKSLTAKVKDSIIIAVTAVNAIKSLVENPITGDVIGFVIDFVKKTIPGKLDDVIIDDLWIKLKDLLPKLLLNLTMLNEINQITDPIEKAAKISEQLQIEIAKINFSTEEQKQVFWRGFSDLLAEVISDGKITWSELGGLTEYVFKNKIQ